LTIGPGSPSFQRSSFQIILHFYFSISEKTKDKHSAKKKERLEPIGASADKETGEEQAPTTKEPGPSKPVEVEQPVESDTESPTKKATEDLEESGGTFLPPIGNK
jgi:hypothetical protein